MLFNKLVTTSLLVCTLLAPSETFAQETDDNAILHAIDREIRSNEFLSADTIDATVNAGVVTLSGGVPSLLEKRQAERSVGSLRGVRAIINQIKVVTVDISAAELEERLRRILGDSIANAQDIRISVNGAGKVSLSGQVASPSDFIVTESIVAGVRGVTNIQNDLSLSQKPERSDEQVKDELVRRLELSPFVDDSELTISVNEDGIKFEGSVGSFEEKQHIRMIGIASGIHSLNIEEVQVDPSKASQRKRKKFLTLKNDAQLATDVEEALIYDSRVKSDNLRVSSRMAAVTLSGNVSSLLASRAAEKTAESTLGVRRVINNLKVKVEPWPGDLALTEQANYSLENDAHLFDQDVIASSHFGKVYLRGQVNNAFEKARATDVVANIAGVRAIINRIEVDENWNEKPDDEIWEDTMLRLRWSPFLNVDDISVRVDDGIVELSGEVDTWQDKRTAERHARQGGARKVKNRLRVRLGRELDQEIMAETDRQSDDSRSYRFVEWKSVS